MGLLEKGVFLKIATRLLYITFKNLSEKHLVSPLEEQVYELARTCFKQTNSNSIIGRSTTNRCDSSRDIAPARPTPAVLGASATNADQSEQEAKPNHNQGVIYQAKPPHPGLLTFSN